jgi:hypothetical protein
VRHPPCRPPVPGAQCPPPPGPEAPRGSWPNFSCRSHRNSPVGLNLPVRYVSKESEDYANSARRAGPRAGVRVPDRGLRDLPRRDGGDHRRARTTLPEPFAPRRQAPRQGGDSARCCRPPGTPHAGASTVANRLRLPSVCGQLQHGGGQRVVLFGQDRPEVEHHPIVLDPGNHRRVQASQASLEGVRAVPL